MKQIDNSTAVASMPAPSADGTPGFFSDGDPSSGVQPTILPAEFMNMVMMELVNLVTAAGLTPSKTTLTQVRDAVQAIGTTSYASNAEALAGVVENKAISPSSIAYVLGQIHANSKAVVTFNGFTGAVLFSYNVASVTKTATGTYAIAFGANKPSDGNFAMCPSCGGTNSGAVAVTETVPVTRSTSGITVRTLASDMTNPADCAFVSLRFEW